jgi:hypothetical protein
MYSGGDPPPFIAPNCEAGPPGISADCTAALEERARASVGEMDWCQRSPREMAWRDTGTSEKFGMIYR